MAGKTKPGKPVKGINIKLKMINDLIDVTGSAKDSWNPAEISDDMKAIAYIHDLADTWNPAQLNEALKYLGFATIDSWNPTIIEETKNKLVKYFLPTNASGNPIELDLKGALPYEVTSLTIDLLPIQDLSQGDPSPTNICPISGRTEVSVTRTGKNLVKTVDWGGNQYKCQGYGVNGGSPKLSFNGKLKSGIYTLSLLFKNLGNATEGTKQGIFRLWVVKNNTVYSFDANTGVLSTATAGGTAIFEYNANLPANNTRISSNPFKIAEDIDEIRMGFYQSGKYVEIDEIQIELGSSGSAYEPYQGETYTETLGQTVYGGKVDFVSGKGSEEWGYIASYDGEVLPGEWISDRDVYAAGTTPTTGAEVSYLLATPDELTTSAEEVTLINGENTLSTDGDNINITYKAILNS